MRKHRNFAQADWALDEEDLTPLEAVLNRMTAGTAAERRRWLFQTPDFMSPNADFHEMGQQLRAAQREAVEDLLGELDDDGIIAFADTVRLKRELRHDGRPFEPLAAGNAVSWRSPSTSTAKPARNSAAGSLSGCAKTLALAPWTSFGTRRRQAGGATAHCCGSRSDAQQRVDLGQA